MIVIGGYCWGIGEVIIIEIISSLLSVKNISIKSRRSTVNCLNSSKNFRCSLVGSSTSFDTIKFRTICSNITTINSSRNNNITSDINTTRCCFYFFRSVVVEYSLTSGTIGTEIIRSTTRTIISLNNNIIVIIVTIKIKITNIRILSDIAVRTVMPYLQVLTRTKS